MHSHTIQNLTESLLASNPKSILMCEGVDDGFFGTISDLSHRYKDQCIELPCSENGSVGMALGAAMCGCLPVLCFQRVEFALLALEQLCNNVGPSLYLSDEDRTIPSLFRFVIGRGWGQGPTHSQTLESIFSVIPSITLFLPCFPEDSEFLFSSFPKSSSPTISLEHRWVHYVERSGISVNSRDPYIVKSGKHLTIVASSYNVVIAMKASDVYQQHGIELEVVNIHSLSATSYRQISESANKTRYLLFLDLSYQLASSKQILTSLILDSNIEPSVRYSIVGPKTPYAPSSFRLVSEHYLSLEDLGESINSLLQLDLSTSHEIITALAKIDSESPLDKPNLSFCGPF